MVPHGKGQTTFNCLAVHKEGCSGTWGQDEGGGLIKILTRLGCQKLDGWHHTSNYVGLSRALKDHNMMQQSKLFISNQLKDFTCPKMILHSCMMYPEGYNHNELSLTLTILSMMQCIMNVIMATAIVPASPAK